MKYKEALKKYDDDMKLKVGSQQAFFYVGSVGHFTDNVRFISGQLFNTLQGRTAEKRQAYERRLAKEPSMRLFCQIEEKGGRKFTAEAYMDFVNQWLRTTGNMLTAWERAKEREEGFKPLDKRDVRQVREADPASDPETVILILEGKECGAFWTTDEAELGSVSIGGPNGED